MFEDKLNCLGMHFDEPSWCLAGETLTRIKSYQWQNIFYHPDRTLKGEFGSKERGLAFQQSKGQSPCLVGPSLFITRVDWREERGALPWPVICPCVWLAHKVVHRNLSKKVIAETAKHIVNTTVLSNFQFTFIWLLPNLYLILQSDSPKITLHSEWPF